MFFLYRLITCLLTPLALLRLHRQEEQRGRWHERLGSIALPPAGLIWVHAASVGEVNAAEGLIRKLLEREGPVMVSTMTATGALRCQTLFGERVEHRYIALDNPISVRRWLTRARPRVGLILETEIWPELFHQCEAMDIPLVLVSARLSAKAMKRYQRFISLYQRALHAVVMASCQTQADSDRLATLGVPEQKRIVGGNLKFDIAIPPGLLAKAKSMKASWGERPIWTAGSTRPGEEQMLIEAHHRLLQNHPSAMLILAPRHPERVTEVARLLDQHDLVWCEFDHPPTSDVQVVLVNQMGILMVCYALGQIAFVGGSLVPLGGHNLLEPAALGLPVLAGPFLDQQAESAEQLESAGGLLRCTDTEGLANVLQRFFDEPELGQRMGHAAKAALENSRGSLDRTLGAIDPFLKRTRGGQEAL
jgi:3-deoxy-D-manno-octulosonic-acid transferase